MGALQRARAVASSRRRRESGFKEAAGEEFAKKLESFARSTPNSTEETRVAKALADRYRLTAR